MSSRAVAWSTSLALGAVLIGAGVWWLNEWQDSPTPSWLFTHTADAGTLEEQTDGTYLLTLTGIDPHVMAFTDRPFRDTQIIDIQELAEGWDELFASSPPNAVLVEHDSNGRADSVVLVLTAPAVDGDSVTYSAQVLTDEAAVTGNALIGDLHSSAPESFTKASLFIDDVTCTPGTLWCSNFIPFDPYF